jgi:outer membrane lipoprotein-sorting protein
MADLVASPIPRLATLKQQFTFEPLDAATAKRDAPDLADQPDVVPLRLKPTEAFLKEHVREVRVLLDSKSARMLCVTTIDADGDRTVMRFSDVKINTGLKPADVQLNVPADVKVSRPMGDKAQ